MIDPEYKKVTIMVEDSTWRKTFIFNKAKSQNSEIEFDYDPATGKMSKATLEFGIEQDNHDLYFIVKEEAL